MTTPNDPVLVHPQACASPTPGTNADPVGLASYVQVARAERAPLPAPIGSPVPRQCSHVRRNGTRCRKSAMVAGFVCASHGGKAAQVLGAARERMAPLLGLAIETAYQVMMDPLEEGSVRLNAAKLVMDRGGLGPHTSADVVVDARVEEHHNRMKIFGGRKISSVPDEELVATINDRVSKLLARRKAQAERAARQPERTAQLDEVRATIAEQQRQGVPDRSFLDKLLSLQSTLEQAIAEDEDADDDDD